MPARLGAGVTRLIVTGSTADSSRACVDPEPANIPERCSRPRACIRTTPSEFGTETAPQLVELATHPQVVAIGECGLDYYRDFSPRAQQRHAFTRQLSLAVAMGKPVFLHQRDAHADFLAILNEYAGALVGGVAHCFTGTQAQMEAYLELGFYIGVTGWICDERRGEDLRAAVKALPIERVMLETDAPYLLPRNLAAKTASRRNEPAHLPAVLETTARCMHVTARDLAGGIDAQRRDAVPPDAATRDSQTDCR